MNRSEEAQKAAIRWCEDRDIIDGVACGAASVGFLGGVQWADAHDSSMWISVNDKMPKLSRPVLLHIKGGNEYVVGALSLYSIGIQKIWHTITFGRIRLEDVDYWMAIPQLPEGDEK